MIRRSRVVIVICPELEETVRRRSSPRRATVLIENAPGSGDDAGDAGAGGAVRAALGLDADDAARALHRTFEAYQGLDLLFAAMAHRARGAARRAACCSPAASRIRSSGARAGARRPGSATSTIFAGERPADGDPGVSSTPPTCSSRREPRHEHAAEDLPVPAVGPADRRDAAADAHAGARRRRRDPDRGDAARSSRDGILRGAGRPGRAAARSARARARARRDEVQLRGVPRAHARRRAPRCARPRAPPVAGAASRTWREPAPRRATTTATPSTPIPAMAGAFDERRFGGPIGELLAETQARGARATSSGRIAGPHDARRRHRHRPRGAALAARGATVTGVDASAEMLRVARARAADARRRRSRFERGDAHALDVRRSRRSTRSSACAC